VLQKMPQDNRYPVGSKGIVNKKETSRIYFNELAQKIDQK